MIQENRNTAFKKMVQLIVQCSILLKRNNLLNFIVCLAIFFWLSACNEIERTDLTCSPLIPLPVSVEANGEAFVLGPETAIYVHGDRGVYSIGEYLVEKLSPATGFRNNILNTDNLKQGGIYMLLEQDSILGDEGYELSVTERKIVLKANTTTGLARGVQTLLQLLPPEIASPVYQDVIWRVPGGVIRDYPEYGYRGAMLDVARHFFSVDEVKSFIDMLALFKMNYCHLHLTDDQGWRIEIKSWPRLANHGGSTEVGGGQGGFYTQEEYREIVAYAAKRHITIVPEIDMPGHTNAILASYPELSCDGKEEQLYIGTEVGFSTLCTNKEVTYKFINNVIGELTAITPGPYIHIGGDESLVTKRNDYIMFIERVQEIVIENGKVMLGWAETSAAKLDSTTIVGHWVHERDALAAVAQNVKLIMLPAKKAYMDMQYDSLCPLGLHWAGYINVDTAYLWNPATIIQGVGQNEIVGIEAPLWTETITNGEEMQYMVLPRLSAYSEIGWCKNETKDLASYKQRLSYFSKRFKLAGWNYCPSKLVLWKN